MNHFPSEPAANEAQSAGNNGREAAIALVRAKVAKAFGEQPPEAAAQIASVITEKHPSKHQVFMRDLASSGKSLAEIQTEWHRYYTLLPDKEKREVWDEFYDANKQTRYEDLFKKSQASGQTSSTIDRSASDQLSTHVVQPVMQPASPSTTTQPQPRNATYQPLPPARYKPLFAVSASSKTGRKAQKIANDIHRRVSANGRLALRDHLKSLAFGLGTGAAVLSVILFGFFNEYFIAPFIQPSRTVTDTPIIMSSTTASTAKPTIIVPKINVQVPVDFNVTSTDEQTVQASLKEGVVHYPSTVKPGENGNGAYFGHSSQNILNSGKFKYAFILLREMTTGDIFYVTYQGKVYAYQVFYKEVVPPTQVSVINDTRGKLATATLITCDPPGISVNRLVVWGEQISPSVSSNTSPANMKDHLTPSQLTSDGPKMWTKFIRSLQFWRHDTTSSTGT